MEHHENSDLEFKCRSNPELIPDGEYVVRFTHAETARLFKDTTRLFLWFTVADGFMIGTQIFAAYPVPEHGFGMSSRFYRDWCCANGAGPGKRQRLSTRVFKNKVLKVATRQVRKDFRGNKLPSNRQYSVVDKILGVEVTPLS